MENNELFTLSDKYLETRDKKQVLEQELKDVSKLLEQIELELIDRMTDSEIDSFKRNGVLFSMVSREFESANPETKEDCINDLRIVDTKTYSQSMLTH